MKLFVVFIFCFLTPLIVSAGQSSDYNCICVDSTFCNDQFSALIRPRTLRQECNVGNQVCCRPEHITQYPNLNLQTPSDFDPNTPKCGRRNQISNGYGRLVSPAYVAKLGEIPWQVAILRNSSVGNFFLSSGALLTNYAILTTAHTLRSIYADQIVARLGENNFQADPSRRYPALNARVNRIVINPDFNRNTLENDVAVLCLNSPVRLSETINTVCLPDPGDFIGDSSRCVVSGWGKNSFNGNYSTVLRKSYQNLVPLDICSEAIRKRVQDPSYTLPHSFVCGIGRSGRDETCTGDAGSPLTCTNKNSQQVLVGISSWGIDCGELGVPGVYSNVREPSVYEWIKSSVQLCIPSNPPVNDYQSSSYNNDYTVVNYNSNDYNSNQNYNGQSDYNNQNYNSQSDYNQVNNNYNNQNYDNNQNYNGQSDYNNQNYDGQLDYNNNQNYGGQSDYNQVNNNYNNFNPSLDYFSNSADYIGRKLDSSSPAGAVITKLGDAAGNTPVIGDKVKDGANQLATTVG